MPEFPRHHAIFIFTTQRSTTDNRVGGGSPLPPGAGLISTTRQWHSAAQYKQLHRKPSSDKNMNIVETAKMIKHPPIL